MHRPLQPKGMITSILTQLQSLMLKETAGPSTTLRSGRDDKGGRLLNLIYRF